MIHELIEIVKEIGVATGVNIVMEKMKAKVGEHVAEEVKKKLTDEHRAELLAYLGGLAMHSEKASQNLLRRQATRHMLAPRSYGNREKYKPGDEDRYVTLLTKLYLALDDEHEKNVRIQTFEWLGKMEDEEFDSALELLNHDVILQYTQKGWWIVKLAWEKLQTNQTVNKCKTETTSELTDLNKWLKDQWWVNGTRR